jgi:hypothetical protein
MLLKNGLTEKNKKSERNKFRKNENCVRLSDERRGGQFFYPVSELDCIAWPLALRFNHAQT